MTLPDGAYYESDWVNGRPVP